MSSPIISAFLIDDDNGAKFGLHGISAHEVLQVLHNTHVVRRNRRGHRATHQVIGLTNGGSCIAIPIEPTHACGVWRPVTAWPCKESELIENPRQVTSGGGTMLNSRPVDREEEELMDPGSWDDESLEVRRPVKKPRAIVSVAFPSADFDLIVAKAVSKGCDSIGLHTASSVVPGKELGHVRIVECHSPSALRPGLGVRNDANRRSGRTGRAGALAVLSPGPTRPRRRT